MLATTDEIVSHITDYRLGNLPEKEMLGIASKNATRVADIIRDDAEKFSTNHWEEETDCGTVRCVAGWVGFFHGDSYSNAVRLAEIFQRDCYGLKPEDNRYFYNRYMDGWKETQAERIGLDKEAGKWFFNETMVFSTSEWVEKVLRTLAETLSDRNEGLISVEELGDIIQETNMRLWKEKEAAEIK